MSQRILTRGCIRIRKEGATCCCQYSPPVIVNVREAYYTLHTHCRPTRIDEPLFSCRVTSRVSFRDDSDRCDCYLHALCTPVYLYMSKKNGDQTVYIYCATEECNGCTIRYCSLVLSVRKLRFSFFFFFSFIDFEDERSAFKRDAIRGFLYTAIVALLTKERLPNPWNFNAVYNSLFARDSYINYF